MKLYEIILTNDTTNFFFHLGYYDSNGIDKAKEHLNTIFGFLHSSDSKGWYMESAEHLYRLTGVPKALLMCKFLDACINNLPNDWLYHENGTKVVLGYEDEALETIFIKTIKRHKINDFEVGN